MFPKSSPSPAWSVIHIQPCHSGTCKGDNSGPFSCRKFYSVSSTLAHCSQKQTQNSGKSCQPQRPPWASGTKGCGRVLHSLPRSGDDPAVSREAAFIPTHENLTFLLSFLPGKFVLLSHLSPHCCKGYRGTETTGVYGIFAKETAMSLLVLKTHIHTHPSPCQPGKQTCC